MHNFISSWQTVLLSVDGRHWKITDFGTKSEATSKNFNTTQYSCGTDGHRPELLNDDPRFNYKSKIFSFGVFSTNYRPRRNYFALPTGRWGITGRIKAHRITTPLIELEEWSLQSAGSLITIDLCRSKVQPKALSTLSLCHEVGLEAFDHQQKQPALSVTMVERAQEEVNRLGGNSNLVMDQDESLENGQKKREEPYRASWGSQKCGSG